MICVHCWHNAMALESKLTLGIVLVIEHNLENFYSLQVGNACK